MCGCEVSGMAMLSVFLFWLIGLPLMLVLDAYVKGRFKRSIFAMGDDEWDRDLSIFFWPIYFVCMAIYHIATTVWYVLNNGLNDAMKWAETKGKQVNDVDYQAEKHILRDK